MKDQRRHVFCFARSGYRGFTLLELLVATALTVLITVTAAGVIASAFTQWNRTQGLLTTNAQAREVLDRLEQDLQGALYRDDGQAWLLATIQGETSASGVWVNGTKPIAASLHPAAERLADSRFGVAGTWLRFFTTAQSAQLATPAPGVPVAVSYQIVRRAPTPSSPRCDYLFYRAEVPPAESFESGYDLTSGAYTTGSDATGAAGNVTRPAFGQLLATNVIDFGVRFYACLPDGSSGERVLEPIFPRPAAELEFSAQSSATVDSAHCFPAVVDVFLRVLTEKGARQIAALETGRISGDWWGMAETNSRVFLRRIKLKVAPP